MGKTRSDDVLHPELGYAWLGEVDSPPTRGEQLRNAATLAAILLGLAAGLVMAMQPPYA